MNEDLERAIDERYKGRLTRRELMSRLAAYGFGAAGVLALQTKGAAQDQSERPKLGELLATNLNKQFYVGFMRVTERFKFGSPETMEVLIDHLMYLEDLEARGILFMAGPLRGGEGPWDGSGMAFIRAESIQDAKKIFEGEPFHVAGLRQNEVTGWQLNEGHFELILRFSKGTYEVG